MHHVPHAHRLALMKQDSRSLIVVADRPCVETLRHLAVGKAASASDRLGEVGVFAQPVVDRAASHLEAIGQLLIGGARQA
jgi:hypothetical protein